jgi:hypothetical protein
MSLCCSLIGKPPLAVVALTDEGEIRHEDGARLNLGADGLENLARAGLIPL